MIPRSMVTGKLEAFCGRQIQISVARSRNPERPYFESRPKDPRFAFDLDGAWRVVARSLSATSSLSRMVSPGPSRNADCNLAPNLAERVAVFATRSQYEIDWSYKAC